MPIQITADGESWVSEDYTLDEMVAVEKRSNWKWQHAITIAADDAEALRALIVVWYLRTMSKDDAEKRAGSLTSRQFAVAPMQDDRPTEYEDGIPRVDPKEGTVEPETI